jgi:putative ATPase
VHSSFPQLTLKILSSIASLATGDARTALSLLELVLVSPKDSVRGSQGSAAMYWLARMLAGGEDPLYIVRRMIVCASEDIGLADNHALPLVSTGR